MAITYFSISPVAVPTTETQLYLVPVSPTTNRLINGAIRITNTTASPITYDLWEAPGAGAGAASNQAVSDQAIPANSYVIIPLDQVAANTSIRHSATTAGLTAHLHRGYLLS